MIKRLHKSQNRYEVPRTFCRTTLPGPPHLVQKRCIKKFVFWVLFLLIYSFGVLPHANHYLPSVCGPARFDSHVEREHLGF